MKANVLATGYGQALLDQPIAEDHHAERRDVQTAYRPVELGGKAVKTFQSNLKKYAGSPACPDYGKYTGYIVCDIAILGLKNAGKNPTRQSFGSTASATPTAASTTMPVSSAAAEPQLGELRQGRQGQLHLFRRRGGRQVEGAHRREAGHGQARRRPRSDRAVREQRRCRRHDHVGGTRLVKANLADPSRLLVLDPRQAGRVRLGHLEVAISANEPSRAGIAPVVAPPSDTVSSPATATARNPAGGRRQPVRPSGRS